MEHLWGSTEHLWAFRGYRAGSLAWIAPPLAEGSPMLAEVCAGARRSGQSEKWAMSQLRFLSLQGPCKSPARSEPAEKGWRRKEEVEKAGDGGVGAHLSGLLPSRLKPAFPNKTALSLGDERVWRQEAVATRKWQCLATCRTAALCRDFPRRRPPESCSPRRC